MIIRDKKLLDPLADTTLPNVCKLLDYNHHSSTQATYPDGNFVFRYLICDQKTRRMFEGNAMMAAGVACNNAIQYHLAEKIFKLNPNSQKLVPFVNEKLSLDDAKSKVQEEFNKYNPVNTKDQVKFERYKETIPQTISQLAKAVETLGVGKSVVAESILSFQDDRLHLDIIGRSDLEFQKDLSAASSSLSYPSSQPFYLLEIKTSWDRLTKQKKDGTWSFVNAKVPLTPNRNHLLQVAFYKKCRPQHEVKLIYVVKDDFKIFDKNNCQDLEDENLENYYQDLFKVFQRRERLLMRYNDLNDAEAIKSEIIKDVDPQFEHPFCWNIGSQFLNEAKLLFKGGNK